MGDPEIARPERGGGVAAANGGREIADGAMKQAADMPETRVTRMEGPRGLERLERRRLAPGAERRHSGLVGKVGIGRIDVGHAL